MVDKLRNSPLGVAFLQFSTICWLLINRLYTGICGLICLVIRDKLNILFPGQASGNVAQRLNTLASLISGIIGSRVLEVISRILARFWPDFGQILAKASTFPIQLNQCRKNNRVVLYETMKDCNHFVRLERREPEDNRFRFYVMYITKNLFGEWSLVREWGRIGQGGQMRIDWCESFDDARLVFEKKRREKVRRGYV